MQTHAFSEYITWLSYGDPWAIIAIKGDKKIAESYSGDNSVSIWVAGCVVGKFKILIYKKKNIGGVNF